MRKILVEKEKLNYTNIESPKKIISLSDIHDDGKDQRLKTYKNLLTIIEKLEPNYICIPGDILEHGINNTKNIEELIANLGLIAPTILSLGNHCLQQTDEEIKRTIEWFKNLERFKNTHPLSDDKYEAKDAYFVGITSKIELYETAHKKEWNNMLENEFKKIGIKLPENKLKIFLCHSPITILNTLNSEIEEEIKEYNLILSGHMHNGCTPELLSKFFDLFKFSEGIGLISPYFTFLEQNCRGLKELDKDCYLHINKGFRKFTQEYELINFIDSLYKQHITEFTIDSKKLTLK